MKLIVKLIENFRSRKLNKIKLLTRGEYENTYLQRLYDGISEGLISNNEDARKFLFDDGISCDQLYNLKVDLKNTLYNLYFLIPEIGNEEKLIKARNECVRNYAIVKRIRNDSRIDEAFLIAKETIRKSMKYHITEITFHLSQTLMYMCAIRNNPRKKYYEEICKQSLKLLNAEAKARFILSDIFSYTSRFRQLTNNQKSDLIVKIDNFKKETKSFNSYQFNLLKLNIETLDSLIKEEHEMVIQKVREGLDYFDELPFQASKLAYYSMYSRLISSYLVNGNLENAKIAIGQCLNFIKKGSHNWQVIMIYKCIVAFHSKEYEVVRNTFIISNKYKMSEYIKEQWRIVEAYLCFLNKIGKVNYHKEFRIGKFLNEVPVASKDKQGSFISIIIAQVLIYLAYNHRENIIDKLDSLKSYNYVYLKKDYTYRSNCFIRILTQLSSGNFSRTAFVRKTQTYYNNLLKAKLNVNAVEREFIPYQDLYHFILELLDVRERIYS